jgi:hypothetical protein
MAIECFQLVCMSMYMIASIHICSHDHVSLNLCLHALMIRACVIHMHIDCYSFILYRQSRTHMRIKDTCAQTRDQMTRCVVRRLPRRPETRSLI